MTRCRLLLVSHDDDDIRLLLRHHTALNGLSFVVHVFAAVENGAELLASRALRKLPSIRS